MNNNFQHPSTGYHNERDPYYPQPILPDTIHVGPIHGNRPRPRTVSVEENIKVAEIKDAYQNLRYKVSLTCFDSIYAPGRKQYQIQVVSYFGNPEPLVILTKPAENERRIYDYDFALMTYNQCVETYTRLVKAETRDFQDISIYKDQIGYKLTMPKCCFTCKWCKKHPIAIQFEIGSIGRLECHNPKNCQAYVFDASHRHDPWHEHCHQPFHHDGYFNPNHYEPFHNPPYDPYFDPQHEIDCGRDPYHHNGENHILDIHPNVDFVGVCDNYEPATSNTYNPLPIENISEMIDQRVNVVVQNTVPDAVSASLTSETLSTPVIQTITMILSGPDAAVALSAPVVNLVTNSKEIHAQTVNLVGDALSSNILSNQMVNAVSATFENPQMSAALEQPVANAMTTPAVQTATVGVIGYALSNNILSDSMVPAVETTFSQPAISVAMMTPVANVIPSAPVSANVINVVENGITIDKIVGNNGVTTFNDKNHNGWQDEGEEDIPDIVLGCNLGA